MFTKREDQERYIRENYLDVTDHISDEQHFNVYCPKCSIIRSFQVVGENAFSRPHSAYEQYMIDFNAPSVVYLRCPVCESYKIWVVYKLIEDVNGYKSIYSFYKVTSIPNDGLEDIEELPEDPPALRIAYRQAIRAMDANAHIAAAAMFRRALQVITRQILKVKSGNLANELKDAAGKTYDGFQLTNDFANKGYIIKEAGNQGAHPDADPDLLDFTEQDARDLQEIFMELAADLFIVPVAKAKARNQFLQRRKIDTKP